MQQVQLHWRKNWLANNLLTYDRRTVWCGGFFIDDGTGGQKNGTEDKDNKIPEKHQQGNGISTS